MSETENDLEGKFAKAEAALKALGDQYLVSIEGDLETVTECLAKASAVDSGREPHFEAIYAVAHDMKGQGTTFDYPLLTEIGDSLCHFIKSADPDAPATLAVVKAHIETVRVILRDKLAGNDVTGRSVVSALAEMVKKATS